MKKIFTLALAVLATMSMWAADIYSTDFSATPSSPATAEIGKGEFITPAVAWKGDFTTCFHTTGSAGVITLTFAPALPLSDYKDIKVKVYWGSPSNRPLILTINGGSSSQIDNIGSSAERNQIREAVADLSAEPLTTLKLASSGGGDVYMFRIEITGTTKCEAPATALSLALDTTKSETSGLYVGDKITFTISGGNGAETSMTLDGAAFAGTEWTATEGEHTFVLSQADKDGICGNDIEVKLNVASKEKVTAATISGNNKAVIGKPVTLTCTAANATNFQWYKGNEKLTGATSAEYTFTPDAAGELIFSCEAWNQFNSDSDHAKSADFKVTVTEGACGLLAKIQATAKNAGTLTGEFTGTVSVSSDGTNSTYEGEKGYKLSSQGSHVGATFTEGTLKAGDKVTVFVTKVSDGKKLQLFSDKGTTLIAETDQLELGANIFVLDDRANGGTGLFAYRTLSGTEGAQYNAQIAYIELKRSCGNESSDASIKSLTVNGQNATLEGTTYSYELPADFDDDQITIAFELNDANATADKTSPQQLLWEGEPLSVKIKVTAEDGTGVEYTVNISKSEAPKSNDATIKSLKIENHPITAVNDTFAYVVPANEDLAAAEVVFELNDAKATSDRTSPFLVDVPAAEEEPNNETINVTAEDGVTKKAYVVSISRAAAEQGLWDVTDGVKAQKVIRNGQLYILKNGVLYNAQGTVVK